MQSLLSQPMEDDQRFTDSLSALAHPARIALLRQLRSPKLLKELKIKASPEAGEKHSRLLARQTVRKHLNHLVKTELVVARETTRARGPTTEYVLNQKSLFLLAEEFRELASLRPVRSADTGTIQSDPPSGTLGLRGPSLVLVKGVEEGRVFALRGAETGEGEWRIGRRRGLTVSLDYDPYISSENAAIRLENEQWSIEDLPESTNGTMRNFQLLTKRQRVPLKAGDLIGVGRSVLMLHP